jgi:copper chaperone NosL
MRVALMLVLALVAACGGGTPDIAFDLDECRYCRMIISDDRFAAAATTAEGRTVRFDSIECLAGWVIAQEDSPRAVWVTIADAPGKLVPVTEARFRQDEDGRSPMGKGWYADEPGGAGISWDSLLVQVRSDGALPETHQHEVI